MPHDGEFAQFRSLRELVNDPQIKELLKGCKALPSLDEKESGGDLDGLIRVSTAGLPPERTPMEVIVAIDGSHVEVPVTNGYPQAEASYLTSSAVLIDLQKTREINQQRPVHPQAFQKLEQKGTAALALSGANVVRKDCVDSKHSFRDSLFEILSSEEGALKNISLLNVFERLMNGSGRETGIKCPYSDSHGCERKYAFENGKNVCSCDLRLPWYSTDWLRVHEGFGPTKNGAAFGEVMQVIERLTLMQVLYYLEDTNQLSTLSRIGFVLDGPLAVFGHPAELKDQLEREIMRINHKVREITDEDMVIVGIEKSGAFVEHFNDLDIRPGKKEPRFAPRTALLITDAYIKERVIPSTSNKTYGKDTYFGRKFFYKTKRGHMVVASVPFLKEGEKDIRHARLEQFPRLASACRMLDEVSCSRYPNAIMPLVSAHAEAAIPLNLGVKILEKIARETIQGAHNL